MRPPRPPPPLLLRACISEAIGCRPSPASKNVEWERASKGRRQIQWSAGLRAALLGDEPELTDEQLAELAELEGQVVAEVSPPAYRLIARDRADFIVVRAFERSFAEGPRAPGALRSEGGDRTGRVGHRAAEGPNRPTAVVVVPYFFCAA